MSKITKDTTLAEILRNPATEKILAKFNLPCLTCPFAKIEMESINIGQVCKMYDIDVNKILKELNEVMNIGKK